MAELTTINITKEEHPETMSEHARVAEVTTLQGCTAREKQTSAHQWQLGITDTSLRGRRLNRYCGYACLCSVRLC